MTIWIDSDLNSTTRMETLEAANLEIQKKFYIGGAPLDQLKPGKLPGNKVYDVFVGWLKNVEYKADNRNNLVFSRWVDDRQRPKGFTTKGKPSKGCNLRSQQTLSFVTSESFVKDQISIKPIT